MTGLHIELVYDLPLYIYRCNQCNRSCFYVIWSRVGNRGCNLYELKRVFDGSDDGKDLRRLCLNGSRATAINDSFGRESAVLDDINSDSGI